MPGHSNTPDGEFDHLQDVVGQLIALKTYIPMILAFPVEISAGDLMDKLQSAATQLLQAFSFLGGHVIRTGKGPGKSGLATIVSYSAGERPTFVFLKDCHHVLPSMQTILDAGAPMHMMVSGVVCRLPGILPHDETVEPAPVFEIQANLVDGGVLLCFQGHHNLMDMRGFGQIVKLYAKALRGEPFNEAEIKEGHRDRRNVVTLIDPADVGNSMDKYTVPPTPPIIPDMSNCRWAYFHFPAQSLVALKAEASKEPSLPSSGPPVPWISTDDALSAFLMQRMTAARLKRLGPASKPAIFTRAMDVRRFLDPPLPAEYWGHMVMCARAEVPLDDPAATSDVPALARRLRALVLGVTALEIQQCATKVDSLDDKGHFSFGTGTDCSRFDIVISSRLTQGWCGLSFGEGLGRPVFSKRPSEFPTPGLVYIMSKAADGSVDAAVCMKEEDLMTMKSDGEFTKWGSYVG